MRTSCSSILTDLVDLALGCPVLDPAVTRGLQGPTQHFPHLFWEYVEVPPGETEGGCYSKTVHPVIALTWITG